MSLKDTLRSVSSDSESKSTKKFKSLLNRAEKHKELSKQAMAKSYTHEGVAKKYEQGPVRGHHIELSHLYDRIAASHAKMHRHYESEAEKHKK